MRKKRSEEAREEKKSRLIWVKKQNKSKSKSSAARGMWDYFSFSNSVFIKTGILL